uniref:CRAL-TRIO domain-containing protein n=1 Tax=Daphnia galeata TaxID=27404 RepID=A0A8J2W8A9_9CRUS|nr:unnamed protein product [Daphnia galeata]
MLRQSLEWRQFNGVDDILNWYVPPELMSKYFSLGKVGLDRFGCPVESVTIDRNTRNAVYVCCIGRMDFKALLLCITRKQCWNFIAWKFESLSLSLHEARKQTGENIDGYTVLMDFEGLALRQYTCKPAMEMVIETMKCFLLNYPDHLRRVFALNAPKFIPYLFTILKPFFNMGGEVHSSYYLSNNGSVAKDYMKETMSIGAGGKKKFKYKVDVSLSIPSNLTTTLAICDRKNCATISSSIHLAHRKTSINETQINIRQLNDIVHKLTPLSSLVYR